MLKKMSLFLIIGLLLFALFPASSQAEADEINWYSYEEGIQKAKEQGKPVFIDFWAEWCAPCQDMEQNVYPDEDVIQKSSNFINIKVNVDQNRDLAVNEYDVSSIPTLVFLDSEGETVKRVEGKLSSSGMIEAMNEVLEETSSSNENDQSVANDMASEEPFWKSLIFIEIVISVFIAISIIIFLNKTRSKDTS